MVHCLRCVLFERHTVFLIFFFFTWKFCDLFIKYINEWYGIGFILINKWLTRDQVTKIRITQQEKKKRQFLCKFFTKNSFFELYVSLTNMYFLLCIMQSHKMMNIDKIISDLGPEERKILMEKLQKDESGEWKNTIDPIWVSFFNFN